MSCVTRTMSFGFTNVGGMNRFLSFSIMCKVNNMSKDNMFKMQLTIFAFKCSKLKCVLLQ